MTVEVVRPMPDDHIEFADVERRIKAIFIGSVGNLVEWYDFYAYTAFALYFAPAFFPNSDPVVQQLNAAVLFVATFLMRPLGRIVFDQSPRARGRPPLRDHGVDVRRHRGGDRIVLQEPRARGLVLLLSQRHDLPVADHLRDHARHQA